MEFEWDERKASINARKHGVRFVDAVEALRDDFALTLPDDNPDEERFVTIGADPIGRILVVIYTYREANRIRLISARKATDNERRQYGGIK